MGSTCTVQAARMGESRSVRRRLRSSWFVRLFKGIGNRLGLRKSSAQKKAEAAARRVAAKKSNRRSRAELHLQQWQLAKRYQAIPALCAFHEKRATALGMSGHKRLAFHQLRVKKLLLKELNGIMPKIRNLKVAKDNLDEIYKTL